MQGFFNPTRPWAQLRWPFGRQHLLPAGREDLLVGDETGVTTAGQQTHGLGCFFSSLYDKARPGLSFFARSLVSREERRADPLLVEQQLRTKEAPAAPPRTPPPSDGSAKRTRRRPTGSRNRDKTPIERTPEGQLLQRMGQPVLALIGRFCRGSSLVLDGHFGTTNGLQVVRPSAGLHVISKLRPAAARYLPDDAPQKQFGPRRR